MFCEGIGRALLSMRMNAPKPYEICQFLTSILFYHTGENYINFLFGSYRAYIET